MNVRDLVAGFAVSDPGDDEVSSVALVPVHVGPESVFFKRRLPRFTITAAEAARYGARHVVLQDDDGEATSLPHGVRGILVNDVNRAYAAACARFAGNAHEQMTLMAVTGTKGKTTTCHLTAGALRAAGKRTALMSSSVIRCGEHEWRALNTTPDPFLLHQVLRRAREEGATHTVIEASSIGIAEQRLYGLRFTAAAFTNFGSDHFEYHGGRDRCIAAKRALFDEVFRAPRFVAVLNTDDSVGRDIAATTTAPVLTFGLHHAAVAPDGVSLDGAGMLLRIAGHKLRLHLTGEFNVYNALAALAITESILESRGQAVRGLDGQRPPAGRLEGVATTLAVGVYVDYAHTAESVAAVLQSIAAIAPGRRRVVVIGCSGNSDHSKRPTIARAAAECADVCVLTSDNPDREHPASIAREMLAGIPPQHDRTCRVTIVLDRSAAIETAIRMAMPDGVVVLMGKGDEQYQLVNGRRLAHSDREVAASTLRRLEAK